jgi:hypothetical protein
VQGQGDGNEVRRSDSDGQSDTNGRERGYRTGERCAACRTREKGGGAARTVADVHREPAPSGYKWDEGGEGGSCLCLPRNTVARSLTPSAGARSPRPGTPHRPLPCVRYACARPDSRSECCPALSAAPPAGFRPLSEPISLHVFPPHARCVPYALVFRFARPPSPPPRSSSRLLARSRIFLSFALSRALYLSPCLPLALALSISPSRFLLSPLPLLSLCRLTQPRTTDEPPPGGTGRPP